MPTDRWPLRLAQNPDAPALARLSRDLIEVGLGWRYDTPRMLRLLRHAETLVPVVCDADLPVGFAAMQFGDEQAHLVLLAVAPSHQRRGVARQLLHWLLDSARCAGMAEVNLELRTSNAGARAFYRAMGFSDAGLLPGYYQQRESALRMRRVLRPATLPEVAWQAPTLRRP